MNLFRIQPALSGMGQRSTARENTKQLFAFSMIEMPLLQTYLGSIPLELDQRRSNSANRKQRFAPQIAYFIPDRNLKRAWLPPGMKKPTPIGVGFLLDVVPPGLEPGTP